MEIKTQIKSSWIELTIIEGATTINCDIWPNKLEETKAMLENVIDDINYMIEKFENK